MKKLITLFLLISNALSAQIIVNEVASINANFILDEDGDFGDYIELYNPTGGQINIGGWGLSDNNTWNKWTFPVGAYIKAGERLVVFADDKNKYTITPALPTLNHWETAINDNDTWDFYKGVSSGPAANWNAIGFVPDGTWSFGNGGFGFGDSDDGTYIDDANTIYIRKNFNVVNKADILTALVNVDYDDGFVAYLNGVEIGRRNISANPVIFSSSADNSHEAVLYQNNGEYPATITLSYQKIQSLLVNGTNVLSIEVHNVDNTSTDMTIRGFLQFAVSVPGTLYSTSNPSWFIPPTSINPSGYYHTNFKISENETIKLNSNSSTLSSSMIPTTPYAFYGVVMARIPDGGASVCYTKTATPYLTNPATCSTGITSPVLFKEGGVALTGGVYTSSKTVELSTVTPGSEIYYTLDGSTPKIGYPGTRQVSTWGFPTVENSTVIKAMVVAPNYITGPLSTKTFIINEGITLPIISVSCDPITLEAFLNLGYFDPELPGETPGHFEFYNPTPGAPLYEADCGVNQNGKGSTYIHPNSLNVKAKNEYGPTEFNYKFFPDKIYTVFNELKIRSGGNDNLKAHIRDYVASSAFEKVPVITPATRPVALFANGNYIGVYFLKEPLDEYYVENVSGFNKDSTDMVRKFWITPPEEASSGSTTKYFSFYDYIKTHDLTVPANYQVAKSQINYKNYIDYYASEVFIANQDWLWNNMKIYGDNALPTPRWNMAAWDLENGLNLVSQYNYDTIDFLMHNSNYFAGNLGRENSFAPIFQKFMTNSEFKKDFVNRSADLMNTVFLPDSMIALRIKRANEISSDYTKQMIKYMNYPQYVFSDWPTELTDMDNFFNLRPPALRGFYNSQFSLGGTNSITLNVSPAGSGTILISRVTPKAYPWTGIYFNGNPVNIQAIPNPGYQFVNWDPNANITGGANSLTNDTFYGLVNGTSTFKANFTTIPFINVANSQAKIQSYQQVRSKLVIDEINYNSSSTHDVGDWIELYNPGPKAFNASGYQIRHTANPATDRFTLPDNLVLQSGERLVISSVIKSFYLYNKYIYNWIGPNPFKFASGDAVKIYKPDLTTLYDQVTYTTAAPWPTSPNGQGRTLQLKNTGYQLTTDYTAANWIESCLAFGSAGISTACAPLEITDLNFETRLFDKETEPKVELSWEPGLSNSNIKTYEIQRSINAKTFQTLGKIDRKVGQEKYTFVDGQPETGINYYRLKGVFDDDSHDYSAIKAVQLNDHKDVLSFSPNPASDKIAISINKEAEYSIVISNMLGAQILKKDNCIGPMVLNLESIPAGMYLLNIYQKDKPAFVHRFVHFR